MPRFFTVRWPFLARLDAILFFPVALMLAAQIAGVRTYIDRTVSPALPSIIFRWGMSKEASFWLEMVIAGIIPYVLLLVLADRLLTVRKGLAVLSAIAVATWTVAALQFYPRLIGPLPPRTTGEFSLLTIGQHPVVVAGGLAFLIHFLPLWVGLRDRGEVAMHMLNRFGGNAARRLRHEKDVYYRQTATFRDWQQEELDGAGGVPKESRGLQFMFGIAWVGIMVGLGFAWLHWSSWGTGGHESRMPMTIPGVQTGQPGAAPVMHPSALPSVSELPVPLPRQAAIDTPISAASLPAVQRPSELSPDLQPDSGPNEAVAERGKDGSFNFDARVNGTRISMLFDTGASVVALRKEDAERVGINLANLNYFAKVKTANGTTEVAPIIIDTLTIGNITQRRVVGYVAKDGVLPRSLLGQTFLAGLSGYNVENNRLVLKGH